MPNTFYDNPGAKMIWYASECDIDGLASLD